MGSGNDLGEEEEQGTGPRGHDLGFLQGFLGVCLLPLGCTTSLVEGPRLGVPFPLKSPDSRQSFLEGLTVPQRWLPSKT